MTVRGVGEARERECESATVREREGGGVLCGWHDMLLCPWLCLCVCVCVCVCVGVAVWRVVCGLPQEREIDVLSSLEDIPFGEDAAGGDAVQQIHSLIGRNQQVTDYTHSDSVCGIQRSPHAVLLLCVVWCVPARASIA